MIRTYTELRKIKTFKGRFEYLRLNGSVGKSTFGFDRYINQLLYNSTRWKQTRQKIIIRDNGCDLGIDGYEIYDMILVHHMNPITLEDIEKQRSEIFDPEFLISSSSRTHQAIHYSDESIIQEPIVERRRNDTCPWRQ